MRFKVGQSIVVDVREPVGWNADVLGVLQEMQGEVLEIKTEHDNGKQRVSLDMPRYLVKFDEETRPTSRGMRYGWFWFDEDELKDPSACNDCGRPIYYKDDRYHHAVEPERGCFLIGPEASK